MFIITGSFEEKKRWVVGAFTNAALAESYLEWLKEAAHKATILLNEGRNLEAKLLFENLDPSAGIYADTAPELISWAVCSANVIA